MKVCDIIDHFKGDIGYKLTLSSRHALPLALSNARTGHAEDTATAGVTMYREPSYSRVLTTTNEKGCLLYRRLGAGGEGVG